MMAKQPATRRNKPLATRPVEKVDLTFGFAGKIPASARQMAFIVEWAKGGQIAAAAKTAGYSHDWARSHGPKILKQYHDLVAWLQAARAQAIVKTITVEQKDVLDEMVRIAFANEQDYIVIEDRLLDGTTTTEKRARRKRVDELSRDQLAAVVVHRRGKDGVDWRWRDRDQMLALVGKHVGMFNEKIIMEHRHRHLHATFNLSKTSMKDLEAIEAQFEVLLEQQEDLAT